MSVESCLPQNIPDDTWIASWDFKIRRCSSCQRIFATDARLAEHRRIYHQAGSSQSLTKLPPLPPATITSSIQKLPPDQEIEIAPDGNMYVYTTPEDLEDLAAVRLRVQSTILWAASPVFKAMFGPGSESSEAKALHRGNIGLDPPWQLDLLDGDSDCWGFIFRVLHHQNNSLEDSICDLEEFATICQKYGLTGPLRLAVEKFYMLPASTTFDADWEEENLDLITMAQVFGRHDIYKRLTKYIILNYYWDAKTKTLEFYGEEQLEEDYSIPESVLDTIAEERNDKANRLKNLLAEAREARRVSIRDKRYHCKAEAPGMTARDTRRSKRACDKNELISISKAVPKLDRRWHRGLVTIMNNLETLSRGSDEITWDSDYSDSESESSSEFDYRGVASPIADLYDGVERHPNCSWAKDFYKEAKLIVDSIEGLELHC